MFAGKNIFFVLIVSSILLAVLLNCPHTHCQTAVSSMDTKSKSMIHVYTKVIWCVNVVVTSNNFNYLKSKFFFSKSCQIHCPRHNKYPMKSYFDPVYLDTNIASKIKGGICTLACMQIGQ